MRFSTGKFVSFLSAPLIPAAVVGVIVLATAAVMLLLSLVGKVPYLGWVTDVGTGLVFAVALLGGFVMALTLLGLVGGVSLMYPTIAAEGTDSFDAISRSFSYLFARPWRLLFYALVGLAYGAADVPVRAGVRLAGARLHAGGGGGGPAAGGGGGAAAGRPVAPDGRAGDDQLRRAVHQPDPRPGRGGGPDRHRRFHAAWACWRRTRCRCSFR